VPKGVWAFVKRLKHPGGACGRGSSPTAK
jgi:hypothetical protein